MTYFYTQVPVQWCPSSLYPLSDNVFIKPSGRIHYKYYPGTESTLCFNTVFYITLCETKEEHIERLRNWILYHAFIFDDSHACYLFECGQLQTHLQAVSIEQIQENGEANANLQDFDNIASGVYFLHSPEVTISYKEYFIKYEALAEYEKYLIYSRLLYMETAKMHYQSYSLFHDIRKYWQVASWAAILEAIIGHAPDCAGSSSVCNLCQRQPTSHRSMSEKEWRKNYLTKLQMDESTQQQYLVIINAAYEKIRHKTAHLSKLSIPHYPTIKSTQFYDVKKSIETFSKDTLALDNLVTRIGEVTRYLLLNRIFGLKFFPPIGTMQAIHVGPGEPP